ncbi:MAG: hypothetical protein AUJ75_03205 [Candidatus Omnitrophica bacterium CG1_02_49_10]|nr:MAG: hypothetical protein AUJ75_03205 [Candidatus Omnitrophica bacterium CG1_02_49_10]
MTWIKICGITNIDDAALAAELGADALGFIFAESPRRVSPAQAALISAGLKAGALKTGVFVDEDIDTVKEIARKCRLDILQFHGRESPAYCSGFKGFKVIKAFRVKEESDLRRLKDYEADYYLLDTYAEGLSGGTGKAFDWSLAKKAKEMVSPIILSGGLNPANILSALDKVRPFGVDASSGLESSPGVKDHKLLESFISKIRNAV